MQRFNKEEFDLLAEKMLLGIITPIEQIQLNELLAILENNKPTYNIDRESTKEKLKDYLLNRIKKDIGFHDKEKKSFVSVWSIAASLLIILGFSVWFYYHKSKNVPPSKSIAQTDIAPGKSGAILTLSDGRKISLDSNNNASIAIQAGTQIVNKNGTLQYNTAKLSANEPDLYNILSTPIGRQYKLILPDASIVWLNAESSIKYPIAFTGKYRMVEITGEVYFEVTHNAAQPFHVKVGRTDICVLGTHFNVNAYTDENDICTTLLQGAVKITEDRTTKYLEPGQQSIVDLASGTIKINSVDTEVAVAWKNGFFQFEGTGLAVMLRQLSRWYNIDVQYVGAMRDMRFGGKLKRSLPLSGVLKLLKEGGMQYTLQGNRLIILSDN